MDQYTLNILVVGATFALYIGIAIWARAGSTSEFYAAGRGVHPVTNGMATAADWMSAASFISMAGLIAFSGRDGSRYLIGWTGGYVLLALLLALAVAVPLRAQDAPAHSELWGEAGELWDPAGRLPDFSWAGYGYGERDLPSPPIATNVRDFGAVGDGVADDTDAIQSAIAATNEGAIFFPPGTYLISDRIDVLKSNVVLRGAGVDETVLYFTRHLEDIEPNMGETTSGRPTSNYSWSGGLIRLEGAFRQKTITDITAHSARGMSSAEVESAVGLYPGRWVEIRVEDVPNRTLADHLYAGDPGNVSKLGNWCCRVSQVMQITAVEGNTIRFNRPLWFDLRPEWRPQVRTWSPTVTESGIEHMTLEMPNRSYEGHFTELGFNGIELDDVAHCWVRNVRIHNADSGLFVTGRFNTITDVSITSQRFPYRTPGGGHPSNTTGHHGIYISDDDNVFTDFVIDTRFVHDISVSHAAGNVISNGRGVDVALDHHKRYPFANLFSNLHLGEGTRPWRSGGGADLGRHAAAWNTYWNITADQSLALPSSGFATPMINLVAYDSDDRRPRSSELWYERIASDALVPQDLHEAMLERRLLGGVGTESELMDTGFRFFPAYPAPASDRIYVRFQSANAGAVTMRLYAADGREVRNRALQTVQDGWNSIMINASGLSSGVYFLALTGESGRTASQKIVVAR